jgi:hypothetical protein
VGAVSQERPLKTLENIPSVAAFFLAHLVSVGGVSPEGSPRVRENVMSVIALCAYRT